MMSSTCTLLVRKLFSNKIKYFWRKSDGFFKKKKGLSAALRMPLSKIIKYFLHHFNFDPLKIYLSACLLKHSTQYKKMSINWIFDVIWFYLLVKALLKMVKTFLTNIYTFSTGFNNRSRPAIQQKTASGHIYLSCKKIDDGMLFRNSSVNSHVSSRIFPSMLSKSLAKYNMSASFWITYQALQHQTSSNRRYVYSIH